MVEKGKRKRVRIINIYMYVHIYSACYIRVLMRLKKEVRQINQKFFKLKKEEYRNRQHEKYRRQDRDPGWLCHIAAR